MQHSFQAIHPDYVAVHAIGVSRIASLAPFIENHTFTESEIERGALIFLGILDIVLSEDPQKHPIRSVLDALHFTSFIEAGNIQEKVLLSYALMALYAFKHPNHTNTILPEKIIIGELHDQGGFLPGLWGVSFEITHVKDIINQLRNASDDRLEKLMKKYHTMHLGDLPMLSHIK